MKFIRLIVCQFFMLAPISGSKNTDSDIDFVYKHGELVGYNCNTPIDLSIHDFTKHDIKCNNPIINKTREIVHFQILQQNKKILTTGFKCSVFKSSEHNFCGHFSSMTSISNLDETHIRIKVSEEICRKWFTTKKVDTTDFTNIEQLEHDGIEKNLEIGVENIFKAYGKGSYIYPEHDDVNCQGTDMTYYDAFKNKIKLQQIVSHYEFKILLEEIELKIDLEKNVVYDKTNDLKLSCFPQQQCRYNLDMYFWTMKKLNCDLYHIQYASGSILHTINGDYFVANTSLIYLKLEKKMKKCET